jgi:hypothetical protein
MNVSPFTGKPAAANRLVNEAADRYSVGSSLMLKRLKTALFALQNNAKIIVPDNQRLVNVTGDLTGIAPQESTYGCVKA